MPPSAATFAGSTAFTASRSEEADAIVIFSEITWRAKNKAGEAIELTPNVTLRLDRANRAVFYYGCVDRPTK